MIVGQQTNGWAEPVSRKDQDIVDYLVDKYRDFCLGLHYSNSPFWCLSRRLCERLEGEGQDRRFLWSNLFKRDQDNGEPDENTAEILLHEFNLLPLEIKHAAPKALVFFTGPTYDRYIEAAFPGVRINEVAGYNKREIARVLHSLLPEASFRTYHPKYLRFRKQEHLVENVAELILATLKTGIEHQSLLQEGDEMKTETDGKENRYINVGNLRITLVPQNAREENKDWSDSAVLRVQAYKELDRAKGNALFQGAELPLKDYRDALKLVAAISFLVSEYDR